MTGTATGCENEFRELYQLRVVSVPLHQQSQRQYLATRYFQDRDAKFKAIADEVQRLQSTARPILVGTRTIADSEILARNLTARSVRSSSAPRICWPLSAPTPCASHTFNVSTGVGAERFLFADTLVEHGVLHAVPDVGGALRA